MPSSSACTTSPRYSLCVRVLPGDLAAGLAASARPDPGLGPLVPSPAVALIERVLCPSVGPASERDGAGCSGEAAQTAGQPCGGSGCRGPGSPARAVPNAGGGSRAAMSRDSEPSGGPRGSAVSLGQWGSLAPTPSSKTLLIRRGRSPLPSRSSGCCPAPLPEPLQPVSSAPSLGALLTPLPAAAPAG